MIKGWTEALQLMKVGSKYQLFIPPALAYGEHSPSPQIPPNSTFDFRGGVDERATGDSHQSIGRIAIPGTVARRRNNHQDNLGDACGGFPRHPRCVAPQIFQAVELAFIAMKDVDHDFEVIEDNPLAGWKAVDGGGAPAVIFAQAHFDFIRRSL